MYNLISLCGMFGLVSVAWLFSHNRRLVNWRVVIWGMGLQLLFAAFIFYLPVGLFIFHFVNKAVIKMLSFANEGMYFVFGPLALPPGATGPGGEHSVGFILVFQALPVVIFFSSLMALLYHLGVMQKIIGLFSWIFTRLMRISGAEALCASSNILVGIESVFTIRPYLEKMTRSELCLVLTAGMSTIASTVMAIYVGFLYRYFPGIAGHLVSASILSAPAAIVMSKMLYPEDERPVTLGKVVPPHYERSTTWIEPIIKGSQEGVKMIVGIVALLLAFLSLLAMVNWGVAFIGNHVAGLWGGQVDLSLQKLLSYLFYPLVFLMGVPFPDIGNVSLLLGERAILTELVAYQHLGALIRNGTLSDYRSIVITAYALCGFAHIASLAIFMGGTAILSPQRSKDLAQLGFRALFAATLACLMTGAVAGVCLTAGQRLFFNL
jgi:CNT family concentrative nucleoside transporter